MSERREPTPEHPRIECPNCNEMQPANGWANHRLNCNGGEAA